MRYFVRALIPTVGGNRAILDGKIGPAIELIREQLKPELLFVQAIDQGPRAGIRSINLLVDLESASQLRPIEPLLEAMDAKVEVEQVMGPDDFLQALPAMQVAVRKYGDDGRSLG